MNVQSRATIPYQCNQVLHPWNEHCIPAALALTKPCFRESFKIYCVLYGVRLLNLIRKTAHEREETNVSVFRSQD